MSILTVTYHGRTFTLTEADLRLWVIERKLTAIAFASTCAVNAWPILGPAR